MIDFWFVHIKETYRNDKYNNIYKYFVSNINIVTSGWAEKISMKKKIILILCRGETRQEQYLHFWLSIIASS